MTSFVDLSVDFAADWADMWEDFLARLTTTTDAIEAMGAISASSHAVTTGNKTFELTPATRVFPAGEAIRAVSVDNGAVVLRGTVSSSVPGSVVINVTQVVGTGGPYGRWSLQLAGPKGDPGDPGTGTVTTVSVATANGFSGTVANAGTTPAISVRTTVTGLLKGNGTAVSAAVAGTDYLAPGGTGSFTTLSATGNVTLGDAAADSVTINAGTFRAANIPSFLAGRSTTVSDVTGDGTVYALIYNDEVFDQGSNYNAATGVFTAPYTARYTFGGTVPLGGILTANSALNITLVTSNRSLAMVVSACSAIANGANLIVPFGATVDMDAGDTAYVTVAVGSGTRVVDILGITTDFYGTFWGRVAC